MDGPIDNFDVIGYEVLLCTEVKIGRPTNDAAQTSKLFTSLPTPTFHDKVY